MMKADAPAAEEAPAAMHDAPPPPAPPQNQPAAEEPQAEPGMAPRPAGAKRVEAMVAQQQDAVRQFPVPDYSAPYDGPRNDFRETVYWNPDVQTDADGQARVSCYLSDAVPSFRATVEGLDAQGAPGRSETLITSKLPVTLTVKMPMEVSQGDTIELPLTITNETRREVNARLISNLGPAFEIASRLPTWVKLPARGAKTLRAKLNVVGTGLEAADGKVAFKVEAWKLSDSVERTIAVAPRGFPVERSLAGTLEGTVTHEINLAQALPGTIEARLSIYPSPVSNMVSGLEGMIRSPGGCFEQASSTNYPNVMILDYMKSSGEVDPELLERTRGTLERGYQLLSGYESPNEGYEWFGGDPGHEALTAYGLMEFIDMKAVFDEVDDAMIARTVAWLKSRRDGEGGFKRNDRALDSFGRASKDVTDAYIIYALTEAGEKAGIEAEIKRVRRLAADVDDTYVLALATGALLNVDPQSEATRAAVTRLASKQHAVGYFEGADHSITRSGGNALLAETTALATLALLKSGPTYHDQASSAVEWLQAQRSGWGNFYSTQSTVLSIKALTRYATTAARLPDNARLIVTINGKPIGSLSVEGTQSEAMVIEGLGKHLKAGDNTIAITLEGGGAVPYSAVITHRSDQPDSSDQSPVSLSTRLDRKQVKWGQGAKLTATLKNTTGKGLPMVLARVGIPGGMTYQSWQLKELRKKGVIDFYETRPREVILYLRSMAPGASKKVDIELLSQVPGSFLAPASSAYLYYTDEHKTWTKPVEIEVRKK